VDLVQFAPFFLFLHVLGAILAFGPTFAYSIMGSMADPGVGNGDSGIRQFARQAVPVFPRLRHDAPQVDSLRDGTHASIIGMKRGIIGPGE